MQRFWDYARILSSAAPAPSATVTVYDAGTLNLSSIFSDNLVGPTPKANPFTADADAYFFFYAASGRYDVRLSGGGIVTPYTWGDNSLSGLQSINGLVSDTITLATGTAGTDFAISAAGSTITFNLPSASATARGVVSTGAQTFAGAKTFSTPIALGSGGTGLAAAPTNGQLLVGSGGTAFVLATLTAGANISVTNGAGSITVAVTGVLTSLNGIAGSAQPVQTFATGTTGADFAISSAGAVHTFNLPDAAAAVRGVVSTGTQSLAGQKTFILHPLFFPGTSTAAAANVTGCLSSTPSTAVNTGTAETNLLSFTLGANALDQNGDVLKVEAFFVFAANGNTKTLRFYVGASSYILTSAAHNNVNCMVTLYVLRRTVLTQAVFGPILLAGASVVVLQNVAAEDLTTAITIKFSGQGGASSDIIQGSMVGSVLR